MGAEGWYVCFFVLREMVRDQKDGGSQAVKRVPVGNDANVACGKLSELSEWQRSKFSHECVRKFRAPQ